MAFMAIYLSYIVFFDLRILSARLGIVTPDLGRLLMIWGAVLAPFCIYFCTFIKYRNAELLVLIFSSYVIVSVATGVFNGNAIEDLSGDVLKSLFIPAGMGVYFLFRSENGFVEKVLYLIGSVFVCIRTALFIAAFGSISILYFGTKMDALMICLGLKRISERRADRSLGRGLSGGRVRVRRSYS